MPPINLHSDWNLRPSDSKEKIEPLKRYYILCEGANTERFYFTKIITLKTKLKIHSLIELVFIEKTESDKDLSNPKQLVDFAKEKRKVLIDSEVFEMDRDIMIVTFDLDVFKGKENNLNDILVLEDKSLLFGIAYPDFELFLLLHIENSIKDVIFPYEKLILENKKIGKMRPCQKLLSESTGINSKKNEHIGDLVKNVDIAIKQEKMLNQDSDHYLTKLTSNIASIIEKIRNEKFPF